MSLNLAYFLESTAIALPDRVALKLDDFKLTYSEFALGAKRVANMLRDRGVRKGDKVAMMVPNTPHFPLIYYGILYAGASVLPLNCMLKSQEIQYQLEDSDAAAFFVWEDFEEEGCKAFLGTETCHHMIVVSRPDELETPAFGEPFMPIFLTSSAEFDMVQTMPEDTAAILYTSGTTGTPKGAELTQFNLFFNAFYSKENILKANAGDVSLAVLPLFHTFGQTCVMNVAVIAGVTMTMIASFETRKTMEIIQRDRVSMLAAVPTMYFWMLNMEDWEQYDLSSLRMAVSGGSALPVEVYRRFLERYNVPILEGYGLTETSPVASFNVPDKPVKPGSIGTPIWGCDMRVMKEDGTFAAAGEVGEIVIRGFNVMKGYYKKPGATEEAIVDGWFHTGDLAQSDSDGYFYIVDRKKDLIIRGGMNIYPREIEEVIYGHQDVVEVCVVGMPDSARGEEVIAYVVLRKNAKVGLEELRQYCVERMARYKVPKEIEILQSLPKGPTGKLLRRALRERAKEKVTA